jgi:hypothetical protein
MIKQYEKTYQSPSLKAEHFGPLIANTLKGITGELNKIYRAFYSYQLKEDSSKGIDNLFRIIERTWVGILNNSLLLENPSITTLQEFSVWSSERNIGRCDLLFRYEHEGQKSDFVTEAKLYEFTDNWKNDTAKGFYLGILNRAYDYYSTEKKYYDTYESDIWLMAFVAEWIRGKERLTRAETIMSEWNENTDSETDFLTLYQGELSGAFVYGKLMKASEFENNYAQIRL